MVIVLGRASIDAQKVDLNANGMSDIWEQIYGGTALTSGADADGDGVSNAAESTAGTNPFDTNSVPQIPIYTRTPTSFSVTVPCELGKQYQLQSLAATNGFSWADWAVETNVVVRTGTTLTLTAPSGATAKFFRLAISDVDTDGDGVNDWEEYKVGLDPLNPQSNGSLDGFGQPMGDYAYVTGKLASQNVVSISATDPTATQPDTGQTANNAGILTVSRGGFPLTSITVNLGLGGPGTGFATEGLDHVVLPRTVALLAGVSSQTISVSPLSNPSLINPLVATMKLLPGSGYTVGIASNASVVIYPTATALGTGLSGQYFTNASSTYANVANFNSTNSRLLRVDGPVDFNWGSTNYLPITNGGYYSIRWTGQVQPQFSETYFFVVNSDDGLKLWVNDQLIINSWVTKGASDLTGTPIALTAGTKYNIKLEYFNGGGSGQVHLSWYSVSQPKQIIPGTRLYPSSNTPSAITSPLVAYAFLGQPFTFTVTGANTPLVYTAKGLPPGLNFNSANGLISGTPTLAGDFQVSLISSNAMGVGASALDLQVIDTGSSVTREVWTNVGGINLTDIPLNTPASVTNTLGTLEGLTDFGDNYGERIRGMLTAPVTGNYYFWIAGSDSTELWVSNDNEPANKVRRAYVTPTNNPAAPPALGTGSRQWNTQVTQKSPWLALSAGQQYYVEILHKAGIGTNDNWAVGWLQDPTGTNTTPAGVVPGYVLSKYYPLPASFVPSTLYTATMLPQPGTVSSGVGTATLRVSADGTQATLKFNYSGLTNVTGMHIHGDPTGEIIFDIDESPPQADGSHIWNIGPIGTFPSAAAVVEAIREGKTYINIHTAKYGNGEINGHFTLADGTKVFIPPPPPPAWADDHTDAKAAARFLMQATFGPSATSITNVQAVGYDAWISNQFALPVSYHLTNVYATASSDPTDPYPSTLTFNTWWKQAVTAPDQLRQRVAFALSEIMVVSDQGILNDNGLALSSYYDTLLDNAFGNFRTLLRSVTLTPAMGLYLDMRGNTKGNLVTGTHPSENYAREIMQLFSVGLYRMWPDGSLVLDSQDGLVPTYDQNVIMGFAATFTGWNYYQANLANGHLPTSFGPAANYTNAMVLVPNQHELGSKLLLDNVVLPPAWGLQTFSTNSAFDAYCSHDLEAAMDSIYYNDTVGPYICRQLIQRLVTSNPSRDYLYRVVQKFNDNGSGVRGDLAAVVRAILLDYAARSPASVMASTFGKQREPVLRITAPARAFPSPPPMSGTYTQAVNSTVTMTTASPHRLNNGDIVALSFTDTSGKAAPASQNYGVTVTSPSNFTYTATGVSSGSYTQAVNVTISNMITSTMITTNVIFVTMSGHGLTVGNPVYLAISTGGASNGLYQIISTTNGSTFAVATTDATARGGNCLIPKLTGGGFVVTLRTNLTISTSLPHGLNPGDSFYAVFTAAGSPTNGQYQVASVLDPTHFSLTVVTNNNGPNNGMTIYPLIAPPLSRAGTVLVKWSTWSMGPTDGGVNSSLSQSPLRSPTVFNFFFPGYQFPGALTAAGLTTPEFQLTSDTEAILQMNFIEGGLLGNGNNTNGLTSYPGGGGAIVLDLGPWMTQGYTSDANIGSLVDALNSLLCADQLSSGARTYIVSHVGTTANYAYTAASPTMVQMRDRARAVLHLILNSPDYTIQR
jgi:uncharacterized protein (DUF1800 family)